MIPTTTDQVAAMLLSWRRFCLVPWHHPDHCLPLVGTLHRQALLLHAQSRPCLLLRLHRCPALMLQLLLLLRHHCRRAMLQLCHHPLLPRCRDSELLRLLRHRRPRCQWEEPLPLRQCPLWVAHPLRPLVMLQHLHPEAVPPRSSTRFSWADHSRRRLQETRVLPPWLVVF